MQDYDDCPQRRSALVARELAWLAFDITALSEVRFAKQGSLTEDGKKKDEHRVTGVGFMVQISIARKLQNLPVSHSDLFMCQRLPIQDNKFAAVLR